MDEVVFRPGDYPYLEKMPRTLLKFKFKNRLRLGTPDDQWKEKVIARAEEVKKKRERIINGVLLY